MSAVPHLFRDDSWGLFSLDGLESEGVDAYLSNLIQKATNHFSADGATLFLSSGIPGTYVLRAKSGLHSTVPYGAQIKSGSQIAGRVLATGNPVVLNNLAEEPGFQDLASEERARIGSSMIVPLIGPIRQVFGVINVSRNSDKEPFTQQDLQTAMAIGSVVTLAVANATLVENLVQRTHEVVESREKLRAVFDSVGSAIIVFDKAYKVVECNAVAGPLIDGTAHAWVGSRAVGKTVPCLLRDAIQSRRPATDRVCDEEGRSWLLTATPLLTGGAVMTVVDLTEAEKAVRESERLHRLAEIGQMTAALAHEIRNPLTGIRSAAQMASEDPASASEYMGIVIEEVIRLNSLCDEFLNFARPQDLDLHRSSLIEIAQRVTKVVCHDFESASILLTVTDDSNDETVLVDREKVEQILHNLLRNAREACKPGKSVNVHVTTTGYVVRDTGSGMTDAQRQRLFTPFFTTKSDGMGLGLCNVKKILDAHGASIDVESTLGKGTKFTIEFPRNTQ